MILKFFKPNWLSIVLFGVILVLPVMEGIPALVLIFTYLKLGELYALCLMLGFAIFAYVVASIVSQLVIAIKNKLSTNIKRFIIWGIVIALILMILLARQFTNEVQWNEAIAYIVISLLVGGAYELWQWLKTRNRIYCIAFGVGLGGLFLLGWVSGAVGIIGSENNSVNLMYWVVPVVGLIGSIIARLKSRGMVYTLFVMALVQFLIPVTALVISPEVSWGNAGVIGVFVVNFVFSALFVVSALLFRRANIH